MKWMLIGLGVVSAVLAGAQERKILPPIKIPVMHADPWFIVAMLDGRSVSSPEMSTILGFMGAPPEASQAFNRIFNGKFVVSPADNAIWFFPGG